MRPSGGKSHVPFRGRRGPQFLIQDWAHGRESVETPRGIQWIHVEQSQAPVRSSRLCNQKIYLQTRNFSVSVISRLSRTFTNGSQRCSVPDSLQNLRHYNCYLTLWESQKRDSFIHANNRKSNRHPLLSTSHILPGWESFILTISGMRKQVQGFQWLAHILTAWRGGACIKAGLSNSLSNAPVTLGPIKGKDSRRSWRKNTLWAVHGAHAVCMKAELLLGNKNNESKAFSLSSWSS